MEFELKDSDKFFQVIYLDKDKLDYTNDIIKSFTSQRPDFRIISKLAILPWVTKDLKFQIENELRFLCGDVYDQGNGPMGGRICSNCAKEKELLDICYKIGIPLEKIV